MGVAVRGSRPPVLEASRLSKSYGNHAALVDLDLSLAPGEILGFLGPNGAGKTTTIRLMLGFLRPTSGSCRLFGLDSWRQSVEIKRRVGYLPGDARFYEAMTGRAFLDLLARVRGGDRSQPEPLAERLGLDLGRKIRTFSKGMKQKLGLIQALAHSPDLIVLDEPTSALDPLVQEVVYELLRERRSEGATVFFSSHVLSEVHKVCDRVAIIREGCLRRLSALSDLEQLDLLRATITISRRQDRDECAAALREAGIDNSVHSDSIQARVRQVDPLIRILAEFSLESLRIEPASLEEVFFDHYRASENTPLSAGSSG